MKFSRTEIITYSFLTIICVFFSIKDLSWGFEMINGVRHSRINNFLIFSNAFTEFINQGNLYVVHPDIHYDYFKYTLTFALFMAPFASVPVGVGLVSWNLLNLWVFIIGVKLLPRLTLKNTLFIVLFSAFELLGSIQNDQSNGIMTGLVLIFVGLMERNKPLFAISILVISVYIKLFSVVFFIFLFFYPDLLKNILKSIFCMTIFFFIPLIFSSLEYFTEQYYSWFVLISQDHLLSYGYSVMGIIDSWLGISPNKVLIVVSSFAISILPLIKFKSYSIPSFRYAILSILLIWVVIFNHKSESPLFILAMSGISIWFISMKRSKLNIGLIVFALLFISIAFSELMPKEIMVNYFYKYSLKALPALIIWGKIIFDLLFLSTKSTFKLEEENLHLGK